MTTKFSGNLELSNAKSMVTNILGTKVHENEPNFTKNPYPISGITELFNFVVEFRENENYEFMLFNTSYF